MFVVWAYPFLERPGHILVVNSLSAIPWHRLILVPTLSPETLHREDDFPRTDYV